MSKLVIEISAKTKEFKDGLNEVKKDTKDLEQNLATTAKVSGAAFAGFTGVIGLTVAAFRKQEQAILKQEAILKSTGNVVGLTTKELQKMAGALQDVTTFGDEAIIEGQNLLLTFTNIGKDVFPQATESILNMSTVMGTDLKSSAQLLGKALNDPIQGMSQLRRVGIQLTEEQQNNVKAMTEMGNLAGAQAIILGELEKKFGGTARAAAQGTGSFIQLKNVFGDLLEDIGAKFVPILEVAAQKLTSFLKVVRDNEVVAKMAALVLGVGAALSGLITTGALAAMAFLQIRNAMLALNISTRALSIGIKGLVGATGIGLLLIIGSELVANWETVWPKLVNLFQIGVDAIKNLVAPIGKILSGAFSFNLSQIKEGMAEVKDNLGKSLDDIIAEFKSKPVVVEVGATVQATGGEAPNAPMQKKMTQVADAETQKRIEISKGELKVIQAQRNNASQVEIDFIKRSNEIKRAEEEAALIKNDELRALEMQKIEAHREELLQEIMAFNQARRELEGAERESDKTIEDEIADMDREDRRARQDEEIADIEAHIQKKSDAQKKDSNDQIKEYKGHHKKVETEQSTHAKAMVAINKAMNSDLVQGLDSATSRLAEMQNSRNATLKKIGKEAAKAQIIIDTAKGAMQIYQGFVQAFGAVIGTPLGIAGAAAYVMYGKEKLQQVNAAKKGAVVGGIGFGDKMPFMLEPGELVTPRQNFDEVVNAVANQRANQKIRGEDEINEAGPGPVTNLVFNEVISDDIFIDTLIDKFREKVLYENADLGIVGA